MRDIKKQDGNESDEDFLRIYTYATSSANKINMWRFLVSAVSLVVIFANLDVSISFFKALLVFSLSQFLYTISLKTGSTMRKIFADLALFINGVFGSIGLFGLMRIVTLEKIGNTTFLSFSHFEPLRSFTFSAPSFFWTIGIALTVIYVIDWTTSGFMLSEAKSSIGG